MCPPKPHGASGVFAPGAMVRTHTDPVVVAPIFNDVFAFVP